MCLFWKPNVKIWKAGPDRIMWEWLVPERSWMSKSNLPIPLSILFYSVVQLFTAQEVEMLKLNWRVFRWSCVVEFAINITWSCLKQLENASLRVSGRYSGAFECSLFKLSLSPFLLYGLHLSTHLCTRLPSLYGVTQYLNLISSLWLDQIVVWAGQGPSLL